MRERTRGRTSAVVRAAATAALVLPLAVLTAACSDSVTAARQTPPPVRIGAIYNLTGGQAALDSPSLDGARLAVDRINARGGLLGRRVELLERDGQTNEEDVSRAAASLVASGCSAIIGLSDTDQVLAAAPIAARAGVPFVTSGATSPLLPAEVPNWLFLACFGDNAQAAAGAQYATEQLGARTTAVLYDRDLDYTRLLARYFERSFRAQGGSVLVTADYEKAGDAVQRLADGATGPDEDASSSEGESASGDGGGSGDRERLERRLLRQRVGGGERLGVGERVGGGRRVPEASGQGRRGRRRVRRGGRELRSPARRGRRRAVRRRRPGGRGAPRAQPARRRLPAADHGRRQLRLRGRSSRPPRRPAARSTTPRTPASA